MYELILKSECRKAYRVGKKFSKPRKMKNLFALISKKRTNVSIASFTNDVLTISQLVNVRGGGEPSPMQEIPIIIPPDQL